MLIKRCKKRWALPEHRIFGNWMFVDQFVRDPVDFTPDLYYCCKRKAFILSWYRDSIDFLEISFCNESEIVYLKHIIHSHVMMSPAIMFESVLLKKFIDNSEFMVSHGVPPYYINLFYIKTSSISDSQKISKSIKSFFTRFFSRK